LIREQRSLAAKDCSRKLLAFRFRILKSSRDMKAILLTLAASTLASLAFAHEGVGRAGMKEALGAELEAEFYAGKRGYLHSGFGVTAPLSKTQKIGILGHVVREETGGELFPSLGAEFIQELGQAFELEAFSFGYFPVERQSAWALGLRGSRRFALSDRFSLRPFFGPTYARVRALDEAAESPVSIGHLLLLGGFTVEAGPVELNVFGSHSFFSRDPVGLETHVDLEEMTHLAAYENNDGFARNTVGAELTYAPAAWLKLTARYALILYDDATRHSITFAPSVKLGSHLEVFAGLQLLRGDGRGNDLLTSGVALSF
jgi:hypothetical protein